MAATPIERPDIYGKIGNSGVSIATLDDMKVLYSTASACATPTTSCVDDHQRSGADHPRHAT
jgi:methylmalonyl-CoA mutase N-terminal domain/subunit